MLEPDDIEIIQKFPKTLPTIPFFRHIKSRSGVKAGTPFGRTMFAQWWRKACNSLSINNVGLYAGTKHTTQGIKWLHLVENTGFGFSSCHCGE